MPGWLPYLILFLGAFMFGWGLVLAAQSLERLQSCQVLLDQARALNDWGYRHGGASDPGSGGSGGADGKSDADGPAYGG